MYKGTIEAVKMTPTADSTRNSSTLVPTATEMMTKIRIPTSAMMTMTWIAVVIGALDNLTGMVAVLPHTFDREIGTHFPLSHLLTFHFPSIISPLCKASAFLLDCFGSNLENRERETRNRCERGEM